MNMVQAGSTIAHRDEQAIVWHSLDISQAIARLKTDTDTGLSNATATYLLTNVGANELTGKKGKAGWLRFLLQFNQPLLIILLCAGLVKAVTGSFVNAGVIWGVTTTNAIIGFIQESKAEGAIAALAKAITTEATIIRDSQSRILDEILCN
jgi:cation-transporting ATPase F